LQSIEKYFTYQEPGGGAPKEDDAYRPGDILSYRETGNEAQKNIVADYPEDDWAFQESGRGMQRKDAASCTKIIRDIAQEYQVEDINFIKPGIGEATRVLLRRIPWKVLINPRYKEADELAHIYQLASEKGVPCEISKVELGNYKVCGIIKRLSDV